MFPSYKRKHGTQESMGCGEKASPERTIRNPQRKKKI